MYRVLTTARARSGRLPEAIAAVKAFAEALNRKYGVKAEVYLQQFGPAGTIYVIGDPVDLNTWQTVQGKILTDEEIQTLGKRGAEVLEPPTAALLQKV